jgi:glycogen(starch) synthase
MSDIYSTPRKVLMTADTVGGVWTHAIELAQGLADQGVEVALATMGAPLNDSQREKADRVPRLRVFESTFKAEWMEDPWRDVEKAGDWLLALEERVRPDVVHLNGFAHGALPWSAPVVMVGHSCVLSWWRAVKGEAAPLEWDRYAHEAASGLAAADLVVAPSEAMLAALSTHYGTLGKTRVILNGRDSRAFKPTFKEPMVFAEGRLGDEARNLEALEPVAAHLPWDVFVAGEGLADGEIRPHHTRRLGRLTPRALAAWLGRAAIYCLPARYEPFGLAAVEAALSGCALVLGDIPSLRETWRHRAVFVPPDDPQALESALHKLIEDPDRRASLAAGSRARALQLSVDKMLAAYLDSYGEVLADRAAALLDDSGSYPAQVAV